LIGANQAGKSSLLLGLASISFESSYEDFDLTQLSGVSKKFLDNELKAEEIPIVEAHFELSDQEVQEIKQIGELSGEFQFTKYYDGSYKIPLGGKEYVVPSLFRMHSANRAVVEHLTKFRDASTQHIARQQNLKFAREFKRAVENLKFTAFTDMSADDAIRSLSSLQEFSTLDIDQQFKDTISKFVGAVQEIVKANLPKNQTEVALGKFLRKNLPRTVYFKSFDKLLDEATLSSLRGRDPIFKTFSNLLKLSGLRIESLQRIRNEKQRQAYLEQASGQATRLLRKAWNQEEMQIEFRYQGDRLMVFIKDSSAVETLLPPSSGSEGFQWFLGFFINFGALTNAEYKDAILLLDDPGVYLHPSAHKDLLNLFEELLSKNVTTIYSTHQPFLIPKDRLDRLRLVTKSSDGHSIVTQKFFAIHDKEVLSPIRAALGVILEDTLLSGKKAIVTENQAEKIYIESMIREFSRRGLAEFTNLEDLIVIGSPSIEAAKLYSILLQINGVPYAAVFSNSQEGRAAKADLLRAEIPSDNLIVFPKGSDSEQKFKDVEDLFPPEVYAESIDQIYGSSLNMRFEDLLTKLQQSNGKQHAKLKALLKSRKLELNRVALAREISRVLATQPELNQQLQQNFEELFRDISHAIQNFVSSSNEQEEPQNETKVKRTHDENASPPPSSSEMEAEQRQIANEETNPPPIQPSA
jgi:predicted ATP-dependent endonuclease of OLD family/uncharacterized membrane-anchored protein YhcB (DUF1043 family)